MGRLGGWDNGRRHISIRNTSQLGPNPLPVVREELLACHCATGQALDGRSMVKGKPALSVAPEAHRLGRHAQTSGQLGRPAGRINRLLNCIHAEILQG